MKNKYIRDGGVIKLSALEYSEGDLNTISRFIHDVSLGLLELCWVLKQKSGREEEFEAWAESYLGEQNSTGGNADGCDVILGGICRPNPGIQLANRKMNHVFKYSGVLKGQRPLF